MKKIYQKPEFQIICQNQANTKFFVASGPTPPAPEGGFSGSNNPASEYNVDDNGLNF